MLRLFILLALLLGTLPAPAAAAPACHEMAEVTMDHDAPAPQPDKAPAMGKALCVGCIAPSTMTASAVTPPLPLVARHDATGPVRRMPDTILAPEPPPPRG